MARWDLVADSAGASFVLAQTVRNQTEYACVIASLANGAWQTQSADKEPGDDNPATCLSAARVNNSSLTLFGLVGGHIAQVWTGAVNTFGLLSSGPFLSLAMLSPGHEVLEWSADGQRITARAPAARPAAPARPSAARH